MKGCTCKNALEYSNCTNGCGHGDDPEPIGKREFKFTQEELPRLYMMLDDRREGMINRDECVIIIESILSERYVSDEEISESVENTAGMHNYYLSGVEDGMKLMRSRIFKTEQK